MHLKTFKIISNDKHVFSIEYTNWADINNDFNTYEFEVHFKEHYNASNIVDNLKEAGFIVTSCDFSYRDFMRLYHEDYDIQVVLYKN